MKDYEFVKKCLLEKHKIIDNYEYLDKYILLLINYESKENIKYNEKHHILPKCLFKEFENEKWNIVQLSYEDHKLCHLWLFKAINIRAYQRPLNWMMKYYKNKEEISNAAKRGWESLRNNKEKYNELCKKRSEYMKGRRSSESKNSKPRPIYKKTGLNKSEYMKSLTSDEQRRRSNIFWNNITDDEYKKFCSQMKEYWTEEKKIEKSIQMKEYYLNSENTEKKRIESKDKWDSRNEEYRKKFSEKMNIINKNEDKRKDAGEKIKKLWKDEKYLEKMKNRTKNPGKKIKIIKPNGEEIIVDSMVDFEKKYSFSKHLIRKYRDTDIEIPDHDLKNNKFLLNCKIKSI